MDRHIAFVPIRSYHRISYIIAINIFQPGKKEENFRIRVLTCKPTWSKEKDLMKVIIRAHLTSHNSVTCVRQKSDEFTIPLQICDSCSCTNWFFKLSCPSKIIIVILKSFICIKTIIKSKVLYEYVRNALPKWLLFRSLLMLFIRLPA